MREGLVYLDNAAATRVDERVIQAMLPYMTDRYAVATSQFGYSLGLESKEALEEARSRVAGHLGAQAEELVFTSGDTESSNMAIKGVALALGQKKGRHLVTSAIEDFAVLHSMRALERDGFQIDQVRLDENGRVDLDHLASLVGPETILVSIQAANQEIGTLQDLEAIGTLTHERGALLHSDATHAFGRIPLDVSRVPIDLVTVSSHVLHGPRGVGGLYIRKGTPVVKWMDGGYQENNLRGGTEDIAGVVGFAEALALITPEENDRLRMLRDRLTALLLEIPQSRVNGHPVLRTPHNANVSFRFVEGESVLLHLDMRGFAVSTGSACFSRSLEGSHVILGIGGDHERAHGSIRFTFGRYNTDEDVDRVAQALADVIERLRVISPLGKE
ncbi:MAG: cysteine desulfurase [Chloroflexi bacterium]|nr:cysteine desulfurase [Chloroflexota bacterium]